MNKLARWLPAAVAPVVVVGAAIAIPALASAEGTLPDKSPQQVLELLQTSDSASFTGTVEQSSALGLPDLSQFGSDSEAGPLIDLLTAAHTAKVYADGPTKQRVQVLDKLAERDAYRDGDSLWLYDSSEKTAEHLTGAAASKDGKVPDLTPSQAAANLVEQLAPTTDLSVTTSARVAGRQVYELVLTPKTDQTLVGQVSVDVDATTGVPLKAEVLARGATKPAASVAFTSIAYQAPAASVFRFSPPADAKVTQHALGSGSAKPSQTGQAGMPKPTVIGAGWTAIAEFPAGTADMLRTNGDVGGLLDEFTTPVTGGRALQTALASALITDDGRVLVGAVPVASLEAAAR